MHFHFSFYSSILLIFFSQGIVFSGLLLIKGFRDEDPPSSWLGSFVFLCCLYICPWMLGHAGWYSIQPYQDIMFYTPTQQMLLIGPVLFFYTKSLLNPLFRFKSKDALHFLPAAGYLLYSLVVLLVDKILLDDYYFYSNGRDKDLDDWYQQIGWGSMLLYAGLSIVYYRHYRHLTLQLLSYAEVVRFGWVHQYLVAFAIMQVLRGVFLFMYPDWGSFTDKWWYYFAFSVLFYFISIAGYVNSVRSTLAFQYQDEQSEAVYWHETQDPLHLSPNRISLIDGQPPLPNGSDLSAWGPRIEDLFEREKLYQNPRLSLNDLAERLDSNPTVISKAVNQCFKMNFNDYVNYHRIESVKAQFREGAHLKHTLLGIALDCGFNSKTTFNRAFKKATGISPKNYLDEMNPPS